MEKKKHIAELAGIVNRNLEAMEEIESVLSKINESNRQMEMLIRQIKGDDTEDETVTGTGLTIPVELLEKCLKRMATKGRNKYFKVPYSNLMILHLGEKDNQCVVLEDKVENFEGVETCTLRYLKYREYYFDFSGETEGTDHVICIDSSLGERILKLTDGDENIEKSFLSGDEVMLLDQKWDYRRPNLWMGYENSLKYDKEDETLFISTEEELEQFLEELRESEVIWTRKRR